MQLLYLFSLCVLGTFNSLETCGEDTYVKYTEARFSSMSIESNTYLNYSSVHNCRAFGGVKGQKKIIPNCVVYQFPKNNNERELCV